MLIGVNSDTSHVFSKFLQNWMNYDAERDLATYDKP